MTVAASTAKRFDDGRFGRFEVEERLGRGGMGEVLLAYDRTLDRHVALKLLREGRRLDPETKARLRREARLISRLDHRNVCRIYDFVEEEDREAIVFEYVEGRTLARALREGLPPAERLRIAERIAEVLAAAHREGIVHRDLKPGNVMLRPDGEIKVLDFGLARLHTIGTSPPSDGEVETRRVDLIASDDEPGSETTVEATVTLLGPGGEETGVGRLLGTPAYMSPEQARGEPLTPASDLYSFGLLLQAMFAERPAHPSGLSTRELLDRARRGERQAPDGARSDLRQVIEGLLAQDPRSRPSADRALERLRLARGRAARRVRHAALVGAVLLLAFLGVKYVLDLRRERAAATRAQEQAESTVEFLTSMFEAVRIGESGNKPIDQVTVRDVFREAIDTLPERLPADAEARARIARSLSEALFDLGLYSEMVRLLESPPVRSAVASTEDRPLQIRLAKLRILAAVFEGRPDDAESRIRAAIDGAARAGEPEDPWYPTQLARVAMQRGELEEAEALARRAVELSRDLEVDPPADNPIIGALGNLGWAIELQRRFDDAEAVYREALEWTRAELGEDNDYTLTFLGNLAKVLHASGREEEAAPLFRQAYEGQIRLKGRDHPDVAIHANNLASSLQSLDRHAEAEPIAEHNLALRASRYGPDHVRTAFSLETLAWSRYHLGEVEEAERMLERALAIRIDQQGPEAEELKIALRLLGEIHLLEGELTEAETYFRRQYDLMQRRTRSGEPTEGVGYALGRLARCAEERGDLELALERFRELVDVRVTDRGEDDEKTRSAASSLHDLLLRTDRSDEAGEVAARFGLEDTAELDAA